MKSKGGLQRISRAMGYTVEGLKAAYKHEHAFRQEVFAVAPFAIAAWAIPDLSAWIRALLFGSLLLILIVELLNSSIEANTDHISLDRHPLAKRAKDMGSAAVFLAIVNAVCVWSCVFWTLYGDTIWRWFV
ncbi:MAG TPA: diacylglycerol kinase [Opitutae bacterium]|nr:diacylglycerol kinase [Opitutae bacterium]